MLHYRGSATEAQALAEKFNQQRADSAACVQADLLDISALPALVERTLATFGRLDGLVNNHVRYHECMAVVKRFGLQHYTFVDDTARLFPTDCPALFLTHRHEGLNATQGSALIDRIRLMK